MEKILHTICYYYGVPTKQIFKDTRKFSTISYRHLFFFLAKEMIEKVSYREIIEFAFRYNPDVKYNHATLINGIKRINERLSYDKLYQKDVEELKERIIAVNNPEIVVKNVDLLSLCARNL